MKNKLCRAAVLALAVVLLLSASTAVSSYAWDGSDPLITVSYIIDTYIPSVRKAFDALIASRKPASADASAAGGMKTVTVSYGGSIHMTSGQTLVLLGGEAELHIDLGSVVNATTGSEIGSETLRRNNRYIVCEDSAVTISMADDSTVYVSGSAGVTQGAGKVSPFSDVKHGAWYYDDVLSAYDRGLINGMTATAYSPLGTLTAAQAVKLAACMHELYYTGRVTLANSPAGEPWYRSYVDYALQNGILTHEFADYNAIIVRGQFISVFYNALPSDCYRELNAIPDNGIPDVSMRDANAAEIYAFYRAGILTGYTAGSGYDSGAFGADSKISRAEVATIMNRMFDFSARVEFSIG